MGFKTRNCVRCYGDLVTTSMVLWVHRTQPISSVHKSRKELGYASLETTCLDLKELCENKVRK